jgi:hypothetical protein
MARGVGERSLCFSLAEVGRAAGLAVFGMGERSPPSLSWAEKPAPGLAGGGAAVRSSSSFSSGGILTTLSHRGHLTLRPANASLAFIALPQEQENAMGMIDLSCCRLMIYQLAGSMDHTQGYGLGNPSLVRRAVPHILFRVGSRDQEIAN